METYLEEPRRNMRGPSSGPRLLDWRAGNISEGTKHTAITGERSQLFATVLAVIEKPASVRRHSFRCPPATLRTSQSRLKFAHARFAFKSQIATAIIKTSPG